MKLQKDLMYGRTVDFSPWYKHIYNVPGVVDLIEKFIESKNYQQIKKLTGKSLERLLKKCETKDDYTIVMNSILDSIESFFGDENYQGNFNAPKKDILKNYELFISSRRKKKSLKNSKEIEIDKEIKNLTIYWDNLKCAIEDYNEGNITTLFVPLRNTNFYTKSRGLYDPYQDREGCFLTTACAESQGLPSNCDELEIMRDFRDQFVRELPNGEGLIKLYYQISPRLINLVKESDPNPQKIFNQFFHEEITPCADLVKKGESEVAFDRYIHFVEKVARPFIPNNQIFF
ncbi:hypothetical protein K8R47_01965 [archaeon]|nr:hypothetical protein [archaeon]